MSSIVQTRDGYLWLATYNGLARFDGVRFTIFNTETTPELRNSRITKLFEDARGTLWIGHETGELTRYADGKFVDVNYRPGRRAVRIVEICADANGEIWLQDWEGLLTRVSDGKTISPPAGNAPGLLGLTATPEGSLWVSHEGRVFILQSGEIKPMDFDGSDTITYVQAVAASRRGGMWVANDGLLRRWQGTNWVEDFGEAPWGLGALAGLIETRDGVLVAASADRGLFLIHGKSNVLRLNRSTGFPSDWLRCLWEDREGNLWIGAGSSGLVAVRASKGTTVNSPDNWQGRSVLSVCAGKNDRLWIGTEGAGIYKFEAGDWKQFGENHGLSNLFVWSVTEDAAGKVWAGTWGGGLFVGDENGFQRVPGTEELSVPAVAVLHREDGSSWIGTGIGLGLYQANKITWFGRKEGLELPDVRAIVEDRFGRVWFGMSGGGLGCLENGSVRQFRKSDGLSSDFVWCLYLDDDDALWIGTSGGGLNRYKNGRFARIGGEHGLPDNDICHIADDGRGYLWMSSHRGVIRASKAELNQCADGSGELVNFLTYGKGDGLPTLECSGGSQPSGCRTSDGRLWFPTSRGLAVINPYDIRTNALPPPVLIEELRVDGEPVKAFANAPLRIPPGHSRLEFFFTGLSFAVPEKVKFKFRLEGLESKWMDAQDNTRRVTYNYVPPGNYTFRVIACNNDEIWNETGASVAFTVLPHFWQTWWFRTAVGVAVVALFSGGVWFITRRRMRRKLEKAERQRAIERERARIAKDIHDDLGASLTRITMLSQTARRELESPEQAATDLDRIFVTARELTRALDEIVWAVNPQHDTLDSLASYLGRFAQDFLRVAGIRCRLDVPLRLPHWPVTAEVRHNLFLAFKEALNNTVKHSKATEARISLRLNDSGFVLTLADNGCGMVIQNGEMTGHEMEAMRGNGLINMRRRLSEIGGRCEIASEPQKGTRVVFVMDTGVTVKTD